MSACVRALVRQQFEVSVPRGYNPVKRLPRHGVYTGSMEHKNTGERKLTLCKAGAGLYTRISHPLA